MANSFFKGKKSFGVFEEPLEASEYIYNKKSRASFCVANNCVPNIKVGTSSNLLLFQRSNRLSLYPCKNAINKANLSINLITKLDLKDVPVVCDFSNNIVPISLSTTDVPYLDYNIDPSGNLFGNNICGLNNYEKYMVYNKQNTI